ncbi:hypothetical protein FGO68_gene11389 [Halteria grandinella]|uniref:Uncharacterized protein n=1 Tax=Halteria grandinella TaxID=5974 RepID=A0A8J8P2S4_HALGN|nr:hypothetical protein FGO68_gene11389 [Halteria grandinella]
MVYRICCWSDWRNIILTFKLLISCRYQQYPSLRLLQIRVCLNLMISIIKILLNIFIRQKYYKKVVLILRQFN